MANKKHTIDTLSRDFSGFKANVSQRFTNVNKRLDTMQPQLQEIHERLIKRDSYDEGFEKGQQLSYKKDGSINPSPDIAGIVKSLVLILGALGTFLGAVKVFLLN